MTSLPAIIETVPAIDRSAPDRTMSRLPHWLTRSLLALGDDYRAPALPAEFGLSDSQRAMVARHLDELNELVRSGPEEQIGSAVAAMLMTFPAQTISPEAAQARAGMFKLALGDLPSWAVRRAVGFWMRREHAEGNENYAFAPSPPQLQRLAYVAAGPVYRQRRQMRRLLDAEVERPISDAQRAENLTRLASIIHGLQPSGSVS